MWKSRQQNNQVDIGIRAFAGAGWRALTLAEDQVERDGVGTSTGAKKRSYSNTRSSGEMVLKFLTKQRHTGH